MSWLIDTNVLSEIQKPSASVKVLTWLAACPEEKLFVSVLTFGEIRRGAMRLPEGRRRRRLLDWLETDLSERFRGRVLAVDEEVAFAWADTQAAAEGRGTLLPSIDALLAATAKIHHLTLVTRNSADFKNTGISTFNPWEEA